MPKRVNPDEFEVPAGAERTLDAPPVQEEAPAPSTKKGKK